MKRIKLKIVKPENTKRINVLSLFDGISGARVALEQTNIPFNYYASEIDESAIEIAKNHFPDTHYLGDVKKLKGIELPEIFLLIGGSPCTDLSMAGKGKGLKGKRSKLFWEFLRLLKECKPKYFLLENVRPKNKSWERKMSKALGVTPIEINSKEFLPQNRPRLYWTNIPLSFLNKKIKGKSLRSILEDGAMPPLIHNIHMGFGEKLPRFYKEYSPTLTCATGGGHIPFAIVNCEKKKSKKGFKKIELKLRKLTPVECERLQGLPDNFTEGISDTKRYNAIGNGFTVPVIKFILQQIPREIIAQCETGKVISIGNINAIKLAA